MKKNLSGILLLITCTFFTYTLCAAQEAQPTRYITDQFRADLRSIGSNKGAIINFLKAGTKLTVLSETDDGWSHIRTSRGTEGWLRSEYLVAQQVAKVRIVEVQNLNQKLKTEISQLKTSLQERDNELKQLKEQLTSVSGQSDTTRKELAEIRKISANAITLNDQNKQLLKNNSQQASELDALRALNDQLKNDQRYSWFMYGAFAACLGAVLALIIPNIKRKRRYSEWN